MLLERTDSDNNIASLYDSSNVLGSIYTLATNTLDIIFKSGTKYRYSNVSKTDYTRFEMAESQGAVFNTHIKKYSYIKLDPIDTKDILLRIDELKTGEDKALLEGKKKKLFSAINDLVSMGENNILVENSKSGTFVENLTKLKTEIDNFLTNK